MYEIGKTYYLPEDWMDETLPDLAADPLDYVERDPDGQWWLRLPVGNVDRDEQYYNTKLTLDQAVSWRERRIFGTFTLTVPKEGPWTCFGLPTEASLFALADSNDGDIHDSIGDLIERGNPDHMGKPLDPGEYDIEAWHWSEEISLMFEVIDGKPSFREVGHA